MGEPRRETYLRAIAGEDVDLPEVQSREDYWLKKIAEEGGGGGSGDSGPIPVFALGDYNDGTSVTRDCVIPADGGEFIDDEDNYGKSFWLKERDRDFHLCVVIQRPNSSYKSITCYNADGRCKIGNIVLTDVNGTNLYTLRQRQNVNAESPISGLSTIYPMMSPTANSVGSAGYILAWFDEEFANSGGKWESFDTFAKAQGYDNKAITITTDDGSVEQLLSPLMQAARQSAETSGTGYSAYPVTGAIKTVLDNFIELLQITVRNSINRVPCLSWGNYYVMFTGFNVASDAKTVSGSFCEVDNGVMYEYMLTLATGYACVRCVKYGT